MIPGPRQQKHSGTWNIFHQKARKCSESDGDASKGHRDQREAAPTGQIRDNLNIKIKNESNGSITICFMSSGVGKASLEDSRSEAEPPSLGSLCPGVVWAMASFVVGEVFQDHQPQPEKAT